MRLWMLSPMTVMTTGWRVAKPRECAQEGAGMWPPFQRTTLDKWSPPRNYPHSGNDNTAMILIRLECSAKLLFLLARDSILSLPTQNKENVFSIHIYYITLLTNQNSIQEGIKCRLKAENSCSGIGTYFSSFPWGWPPRGRRRALPWLSGTLLPPGRGAAAPGAAPSGGDS